MYYLSCYSILGKALIRKTYKSSLSLIIQNLLSHNNLLVILPITLKSDILVCENLVTALLTQDKEIFLFVFVFPKCTIYLSNRYRNLMSSRYWQKNLQMGYWKRPDVVSVPLSVTWCQVLWHHVTGNSLHIMYSMK